MVNVELAIYKSFQWREYNPGITYIHRWKDNYEPIDIVEAALFKEGEGIGVSQYPHPGTIRKESVLATNRDA